MSTFGEQVAKNADQWFVTELESMAESNQLAKFVLEQVQGMYLHNPSEQDMYDALMIQIDEEVDRLKGSENEVSQQQIEHIKKVLEKYLKSENQE